MPFYLRKSFSVGPLRLNLSRSGLGVSFGVRGLRAGTGPRGKYVQGGRGCLYFRHTAVIVFAIVTAAAALIALAA